MRTLHASTKDKYLAGICGGLAESTGIDATIIRLIFIASIFFGGTGLLVYLLLWVILPKQDIDPAVIDIESEREGEKAHKIYRIWDGRMIAGVCAGLASYLQWDVSLVRIIFIIVGFSGGVGILLYLFFWFIFPLEDECE
jgi:phage shock protein PspC (stress-responsive transcriptional regulator)